MLRDATQDAARNLDNLVVIKPEHDPEVARLGGRYFFPSESIARGLSQKRATASSRAKASSRRHRVELAEMKKATKKAVEEVLHARSDRAA